MDFLASCGKNVYDISVENYAAARKAIFGLAGGDLE
jgi:hypothetical protein